MFRPYTQGAGNQPLVNLWTTFCARSAVEAGEGVGLHQMGRQEIFVFVNGRRVSLAGMRP